MLNDLIIDDIEYFETIKKYDYVICYGCGAKGEQTVQLLKSKGIEIYCFIDSDEKKWNTEINGIKILDYNKVKHLVNKCIIITTVYPTAVKIKEYLISNNETGSIMFCANPYKSEIMLLAKKDVIDNDKAKQTYNFFSDELSKNLWTSFINWKITGDNSLTAKYTEGNWLEFFSTNLIPNYNNYTYIDIGAYTGDTIIRFLSFCKGMYNKIIAFEPDKANYKELTSFIENARLPKNNIILYEKGLWSENTTLKFNRANDLEKYESSNFYSDTNLIIPQNRKENKQSGQQELLKVYKLDSFIENLNGNILMKIDALSSEYEILCGAAEIIKKYHPIIVMEIGTRYEKTFETIPFLYSLNLKYQFYLRQLNTFNNTRTIMIAR